MKNPPAFLHTFFPSENIPEQNKELVDWYMDTDFETYRQFVNEHDSVYWMKQGELRAIEIFHQTAEHVPAYKDFLQKQSLDHKKVITLEDFEKYVPLIDKKNYITQYELSEMCWDGNLTRNTMTSFSSGTSGTQCYWPRSAHQDVEGAFMFEQFLCSVFEMHKKKTLFVLCFALGNYVAGTYVLSCLNYMMLKGYPVMVVTPGISQEDAIRMVSKLGPDFEQTILCGYPPLLRDLLHAGEHVDIHWKNLAVRFLFSSELFSEVWRDRVLSEAGTAPLYRNSTNLYGTADATLFGMEHPLDAIVRKKAAEESEFHQLLFGHGLTPTFTQYNPLLRYFEKVGDELVLTSLSGLPLVRYNLHDQGGIHSQERVVELSTQAGLDVMKKIEEQECLDTIYNFPHVYIFGRTDGSVSLYGLLIHPEYIKTGLEDERVYKLVSGKFTMSIEQDKKLSPQLKVYVELAPEITLNEDEEKLLFKSIFENLRKRSAEYNRLVEALGKKARPVVETFPYGQNEMFKVSIKQKWIKRT